MKQVFLIERSPDVLNTVKSHLRKNGLSFLSFQSVEEAGLSEHLPVLIVLFGTDNLEEMRQDLGILKNNPSYFRIPKILVLPLHSSITDTACEGLDVQGLFTTPVEQLRFQALVSKFLGQAPRRVFRILVTVQQGTSTIRHSGISVDFSQSGMAFECVHDFPMGEKLIVSFVNPRSMTRFSLKAEVARKKSIPISKTALYGVAFSKLSEKEAGDLAAFISGEA